MMAVCNMYYGEINGHFAKCNKCGSNNIMILEDLDDAYMHCRSCGLAEPVGEPVG